MIAFASSLDQAGTFTRDVTDAALLLARWSARTRATARASACRSRSKLPTATDLKGIRLGVPEELTGEGIEPGVLEAFHETLDLARGSARRWRRRTCRTRRTRSPPTT